MSIKKQLTDLRHGDISEAFEAAKDLSNRSHPPVKDIIEVLNEAKNAHNREAAAYALSWIDGRRSQEPLQALLATFNKAEEYPSVRGQALEGFGLHRPMKRNRLWSRVEAAILRGLVDESVEIRFWACYAAGELRIKTALPSLNQIAITDFEICPNWWRVSEEASDAIEWIHGRETLPRLRISQYSEE